MCRAFSPNIFVLYLLNSRNVMFWQQTQLAVAVTAVMSLLRIISNFCGKQTTYGFVDDVETVGKWGQKASKDFLSSWNFRYWISGSELSVWSMRWSLFLFNSPKIRQGLVSRDRELQNTNTLLHKLLLCSCYTVLHCNCSIIVMHWEWHYDCYKLQTIQFMQMYNLTL